MNRTRSLTSRIRALCISPNAHNLFVSFLTSSRSRQTQGVWVNHFRGSDPHHRVGELSEAGCTHAIIYLLLLSESSTNFSAQQSKISQPDSNLTFHPQPLPLPLTNSNWTPFLEYVSCFPVCTVSPLTCFPLYVFLQTSACIARPKVYPSPQWKCSSLFFF